MEGRRTSGAAEQDVKEPPRGAEELRLVLLGSAGSGKASVLQHFHREQSCGPADGDPDCHKSRAEVVGRQVCVVNTPERLCEERSGQDVRRQFSLCAALAAPGPHAFLLCVPLDRPSNLEMQILETIEKVFGPAAVSQRALVLLTGAEPLEEHLSTWRAGAEPLEEHLSTQWSGAEPLEEYLSTQRPDLLELIQKCGGRHHPLPDLEQLLEKVERMGAEFYTCPLLQEAERRVKAREEEILRSGGEAERAREEAELSVEDLEVGGISELCLSSPDAPPLRRLWAAALQWLLWLPNMVRGSALLGSIVGLFVGGPLGGAMGAAVGSVATEVERRKKKHN